MYLDELSLQQKSCVMEHQGENGVLAIPIRRTGLDRQTPFSFSCMRCLHCCRNKKIQVNPYEVARLAGNLGISTTECIARYTIENSSFLKFDDNDTCIFLGPAGCTVHPDRPLVCRLYPLGRHVNETGEEWFSELQPDERCKGEYSEHETIGNYLEEQDTAAYMLAADNYLKLLWEMMTVAESSSTDEELPEPEECSDSEEDNLPENVEWMDMDAALRAYCKTTQTFFPDTVEEKMRMHLDALHRWTKIYL